MTDLAGLITGEHEDEELERAKQFKERWDLYEGRHPDTLPVVRGTEGRPDVNDNIKYNAAGLTVDRGVSALLGGLDQEITFALQEDNDFETTNTTLDAQDEESGDPGESPDQAWLEQCWEANAKRTLLTDVATNGGVCGHMFLRLYETGARLDRDMPRIVNLDPAYCLPIYAEDDYEVVLGWKIQFPLTRKRTRRTLIEPDVEDLEAFDPTTDEVTKWRITDQEHSGEKGETWQTIDEATWDYDFPPIIDGKNLPRPNSYWGRSDIENDVRDMNYAMNRALSSMQRILRLFGHPRPWVAGVTPDQIAMLIQGVDRIITLPTGAKLEQLEMAGDLQASIEFMRQLKSAFSDVAKNPQVDPEKLGSIGGLSGVALRILYQPLLEQTGLKRGTYGDTLTELNRRLLVLGGIEPSPVTINWPNPMPMDIKETTDALVAQRELGLSQETALETLGYDPALESERRQNDDVSVGTLGASAAAAAAIKAGDTGDLVDDMTALPSFNGGTAT